MIGSGTNGIIASQQKISLKRYSTAKLPPPSETQSLARITYITAPSMEIQLCDLTEQ